MTEWLNGHLWRCIGETKRNQTPCRPFEVFSYPFHKGAYPNWYWWEVKHETESIIQWHYAISSPVNSKFITLNSSTLKKDIKIMQLFSGVFDLKSRWIGNRSLCNQEWEKWVQVGLSFVSSLVKWVYKVWMWIWVLFWYEITAIYSDK